MKPLCQVLLVPALLALVPLLSGQGDPGTVPASLRNAFGNGNNVIPFAWTPVRYQQCFLASELPTARLVLGLALRQDDGFAGYQGRQIDVEMKIGHTSFDQATITATFDTNFNVSSSTPTPVLPRTMLQQPNMAPTVPTDPKVFFWQIPFRAPLVWVAVPGRNLLIDVVVWGNSNSNQIFTYPLDSGGSTTTTRVYGAPTATSGSMDRGYGLVMSFLDRLSISGDYKVYGTGCKGSGGGNGIPGLTATGRPVINTSFSVDLSQARANAPALLVLGVSDTQWGAFQLPLDLTAAGAPGCKLLASFDTFGTTVASGAGAASVTLPLPNDRALTGLRLYNQYLVIDSGANKLGIAFSNGGDMLIGDK